MSMPDKLSYTKGEKAAEIAGGTLLAAIIAAEIILMATEIFGGESIIIVVVTLIIYGAFSLAAVYPQHTNLVSKDVPDEKLHSLRRGCIVAKILLTLVVSGLPMITFIL